VSLRWVWGVVLLLSVVGLWRLPQGDVVRAQALHMYAVEIAVDDPSDPVWVDVHREWASVQPWQSGYSEARDAASQIEARRRGLLRDSLDD
jgi:hypothetical protein